MAGPTNEGTESEGSWHFALIGQPIDMSLGAIENSGNGLNIKQLGGRRFKLGTIC
jgi:hypothetical protein